MILRATLVLVGLVALPVAALAQTPCVGWKLERPMPGATMVEWHSADVQSARFSGMWQQGILDGYSYRIFPDQTVTIVDSSGKSEWRLEVSCNLSKAYCTQTGFGNPPGGAANVAKTIGKCLAPLRAIKPPHPPAAALPVAKADPSKLADASVPKAKPAPPSKPKGASASKPDPAAKPEPATKPEPSGKPQPPAKPVSPAGTAATVATGQPSDQRPAGASGMPIAAGAQPSPAATGSGRVAAPVASLPAAKRQCAAASVTDLGSSVRAIQRLLTEIGYDVGPIDGVRGKRTVSALAAELGPEAANLDAISLLIALVAKICAGGEGAPH